MRCDHCGAFVRDGSELREHLREKHPGKAYGLL